LICAISTNLLLLFLQAILAISLLSEISNNPSATPLSPTSTKQKKRKEKNPFKHFPKTRNFYFFKSWPLQNKLAHFDHAHDHSLVIGCAMKKNCAIEMDTKLQTLKKPTPLLLLLLLPLHKNWGVGLGPSSKSLWDQFKAFDQ
jgi:hypothetical protein